MQGPERFVVELTTSTTGIVPWNDEMLQRARIQADNYAEFYWAQWGFPFAVAIRSGRLWLQFPAAIRWTLGEAVKEWVRTGEGSMPDPRSYSQA